MIDSISRQPAPGQALYADQIDRLAWREKMRIQILNQVRSVSPAVNNPQNNLPAHPAKGGLLDVYI